MPQRHLQSGVLPPGTASFEEGAVVCLGLDHGMGGARHLGGDRGERLALEMGIGVIASDVAFVLVAEAILALPDGDLASHPECAPEPGVAILRQFRLAAEDARLLGRQVEPAELQELAVVPKPAQIARFGQNGQRVDRANARDRL